MFQVELKNNPATCRYFIWCSNDILGHCLLPVSSRLIYEKKSSLCYKLLS